MDESTTTEQWNVVINGEEQYSIWPAHREPPKDWNRVGQADSREACLNRIETLWTDMRPKSLREHMEAAGQT